MKPKRSLKSINWNYAIGEIIIVIIGISIAFSLNRWAENAKDQKSRELYLQSLITDLEGEAAHLQENIFAFSKKLEHIGQITPYLYGQQQGRDTMVWKIFALAEIIHFKPQDVTYKTLINSGDLGLFDDFELKKQLEDYYSSHESLRLDYHRQHHINEQYFADFMIYHMEYDKVQKGDFSFMDNKMLKNIVQSLVGTYRIAIQSSKKGIVRSEQIKKLLQEKL